MVSYCPSELSFSETISLSVLSRNKAKVMHSAVCQCVFLIACAFVGLSAAVGVQDRDSESRTLLAQRLQPFQVRGHLNAPFGMVCAGLLVRFVKKKSCQIVNWLVGWSTVWSLAWSAGIC